MLFDNYSVCNYMLINRKYIHINEIQLIHLYGSNERMLK